MNWTIIDTETMGFRAPIFTVEILCYGEYSHKKRGLRAQAGATAGKCDEPAAVGMDLILPEGSLARQGRQRWAALIKQVYETDPLVCPQCGGTMRIIAFIERRQAEVIRKILQHCGLWEERQGPPETAPPVRTDWTYEPDLDFDPGQAKLADF